MVKRNGLEKQAPKPGTGVRVFWLHRSFPGRVGSVELSVDDFDLMVGIGCGNESLLVQLGRIEDVLELSASGASGHRGTGPSSPGLSALSPRSGKRRHPRPN